MNGNVTQKTRHCSEFTDTGAVWLFEPANAIAN